MTVPWPADLDDELPAYLAAQRWYSGSEAPDRADVEVVSHRELWSEDDRALLQAVVSDGPARYQLLLATRPAGEPAEFLHGRESAVLGLSGGRYVYDATVDAEMAKVLLEVVSGGAETAERARPMAAEQSNTSIVYDDRLILKLFRRLRSGVNPDVEVTKALAGAGFDHVARPLVEWRDDEYELAFGQEFLAGGTEGWALALTSLRELYSSRDAESPAGAGGDFSFEAGRLGRVTAEMHAALRDAFGAADPAVVAERWQGLVAGLGPRLERAGDRAGRDLLGPAGPMLDRLAAVIDPGPAFRVHGDYHLGQVMRTDGGWYVLDFEGEPAKSVEERVAPASPLKDVTGMLRSFHYASRHALVERASPDWAALVPAAREWEAHNRQAFLDGYQGRPGVADLLPDPASAAAVMSGYELDKALYELDYELSYRPEWVAIPLDALERLVEGSGVD